MRQVDVALDGHADLGEGPWWDQQGGELLWVDIFAGRVHMFDPASGQDRYIEIGQPVGMVARRQAGGLVCAVRDGIGIIDPDESTFKLVAPIETDKAGNRMNDGACDAAGRLWAGTMATDLSPSAGALYRISTTLHVAPVLTGVSISNGLDWSPDGQTFYFTDSATRRLDAYDYDIETGTVSNGRVLVDLRDPVATPDGIAVDAEGTIWVAMWDGGRIERFSPSGKPLETVRMPVTRPTSLAFGGPDLDQLFISSARNGLSALQKSNEPHAGAIFVIRPGSTGRLPWAFGG